MHSSLSPICSRLVITRPHACLASLRFSSATPLITSYQFIGGGDILHLIFPDLITARLRQIHYCRVRHRLYCDCRHGIGRLHGCCDRSACYLYDAYRATYPRTSAGGWSAVHSSLPATHFQVLGDLRSFRALELFLPTCLLMLGNQSMYQKFFSAKSEKDATRAVVGWIIGTVILETVIVALAVGVEPLSWRRGPRPSARDSRLPWVAWLLRFCTSPPAGRAADGGHLREDYLHGE